MKHAWIMESNGHKIFCILFTCTLHIICQTVHTHTYVLYSVNCFVCQGSKMKMVVGSSFNEISMRIHALQSHSQKVAYSFFLTKKQWGQIPIFLKNRRTSVLLQGKMCVAVHFPSLAPKSVMTHRCNFYYIIAILLF